ncbi:MAG TPA: hypothetical protein VGL80_22225 [Pseudonocardiaceae bacterium]
MSSPARTALRGAVGLATALVAVTACTSDKRAPPDDRTPGAWPTDSAGHVYRPSTDPLSSTSGSVINGAPSGAGTKPVPDLAAPRQVAVAAARTVCNFDWHQTLAQRVAALRRYATVAYARALEPSSGDQANWRSTQRDKETGTCTGATATLVRTAPNAATVYFERVRMQQKLTLPKKTPTTQTFEVLYRVEKQYDGHWLVGAEGDGG